MTSALITSALAILRLIPPRALFSAVAIALALAGLVIFIKDRERAAATRATATIERANHAAMQHFNQGSEAVAHCYDIGGEWDRFERLCKHSPR